jgi:hypothetical protein
MERLRALNDDSCTHIALRILSRSDRFFSLIFLLKRSHLFASTLIERTLRVDTYMRESRLKLKKILIVSASLHVLTPSPENQPTCFQITIETRKKEIIQRKSFYYQL